MIPAARPPRPTRRRLAVGVAVVTVVGLALLARAGRLPMPSLSPGAWLPARVVPLDALQAIAPPDVALLDALARTQIEAAHQRVITLRDGPSPDRQSLGAAFGEYGALLLAYDLPGAAAPLANAETLVPSDLRWPYYLGRAARLAGDFETAAAAYARALALAPSDVPTRVRVAQMDYELGRVEEAVARLEGVLADAPRTALAHDILGQIALDRDDPTAAIRHFEAVLALQPDASALHAPLAEAYRKAGQPEKGQGQLTQLGTVRPTIEDPLETALEQSKVGPSAWLAQADGALRSGNPVAAISLYEKVVRDDPRNARAFRNLGVARGELGDAEGAVRDIQTSARIDPADGDIHLVLGEHLARAGRPAEAEAAFREAVAREPGNGGAQLALAELLRAGGRCEAALPFYAAAVELRPTDSIARVQQTFCLVLLGRYADARQDLEAAIAQPPADPDVVDALARLLAAAPDDAVRDGPAAVQLAESLQRQRQSADARETLAMAYAEAGQFETAIRWQTEAIQMATAERQTAWLETLNANLARYREGQPSRMLWPPYVLQPGAVERP